jgi:hypothetical protein
MIDDHAEHTMQKLAIAGAGEISAREKDFDSPVHGSPHAVSDEARQRATFQALDKNGDGRITVEEVQHGLGVSKKEAQIMLKKFGGKKSAKKGLVMADLDIDEVHEIERLAEGKDGQLAHLAELEDLAALEDLADLAALEDLDIAHGSVFDQLNTSHTGKLEVSEIAEGLHVSEKTAKKLVKQAGGKKALQNGGITAEQLHQSQKGEQVRTRRQAGRRASCMHPIVQRRTKHVL